MAHSGYASLSLVFYSTDFYSFFMIYRLFVYYCQPPSIHVMWLLCRQSHFHSSLSLHVASITCSEGSVLVPLSFSFSFYSLISVPICYNDLQHQTHQKLQPAKI
jgi:hypothetical protein